MGIVAAAVVGEVLLRVGEVARWCPRRCLGIWRGESGGLALVHSRATPLVEGGAHMPHKTPAHATAAEARLPSLLTWLPGSWRVKRETRGSETPCRPHNPPPYPRTCTQGP